eukprot:13258849-Heterocapsa_arctica.AAC.1
MEGQQFAASALGFCKVSKTLSRHEDVYCMKLCEVMKTSMKPKITKLVKTANNHHILYSYKSDATPLRTTVRFVESKKTNILLPVIRE